MTVTLLWQVTQECTYWWLKNVSYYCNTCNQHCCIWCWMVILYIGAYIVQYYTPVTTSWLVTQECTYLLLTNVSNYCNTGNQHCCIWCWMVVLYIWGYITIYTAYNIQHSLNVTKKCIIFLKIYHENGNFLFFASWYL